MFNNYPMFGQQQQQNQERYVSLLQDINQAILELAVETEDADEILRNLNQQKQNQQQAAVEQSDLCDAPPGARPRLLNHPAVFRDQLAEPRRESSVHARHSR